MKSKASQDSAADYSCYYSLLQERFDQMNDNSISSKPRQPQRRKAAKNEASNGGGDAEEGKPEVKTKEFKEIITSLFFLDEQDKSDKDNGEKAREADKKKAESMSGYVGEYQEHDDVMDPSNRVRKRKSRGSAASAPISTDLHKDLNLNTSCGGDGAAVAGGGGGGGVSAPQRRLWVKNRSKDWWDKYNSADISEEEFRKAFRMGKDTFEIICNDLTAVVAKENTMLRDAVPVRQRVAVCIWRLATGEPLRLVSRRFGLGISTCHKLVLEVCSAIKNVLMPKYLQWPDDESMKVIKDEFESISGIPNVVGSMYTTHIPIIAPKVNVAAYFNKRHTDRCQKTSYSITVQGVVDPRGVFTDVCIGWPGSMPDDQVLEKSALHQRANGGLLKGVWIVGSSGYPLMDWVLVPYTQPHLTWTQHAFNEKIGDVQKVAKDAFARLKGRWSCLQKRTEVKLQELPVVLGACCVLHNICEMRNESIEPESKIDIMDDEMVPEIDLRSAMAMKARDTIAHNLLHHNHAGTSFLS